MGQRLIVLRSKLDSTIQAARGHFADDLYSDDGGVFVRTLGSWIHGVVWASRIWRGRYDDREIVALSPFVDPGSIVLDVGAHAGSWSAPLSRLVGKEGMVVAYEPLPHYARSLRVSLQILGRRNVMVRNVAVGASTGRQLLRWRDAAGTPLTGRTHLDANAESAGGGVLDVEVCTIDGELGDQIDVHRTVSFIKIDVEGAELEVLQGAHKTILRHSPAIYLEAEEQWSLRRGHELAGLWEFMENMGYASNYIESGRLMSCPGPERFVAHGGNVLFTRRAGR